DTAAAARSGPMPVSATSTDSHSGPQKRARHGAPGKRCCGRNSRQNARLSWLRAKTTHGSSMVTSFTRTAPPVAGVGFESEAPARKARKHSSLALRTQRFAVTLLIGLAWRGVKRPELIQWNSPGQLLAGKLLGFTRMLVWRSRRRPQRNRSGNGSRL